MTSAPALDIIETMNHPALFQRWFRDPATWAAWRAFLAAMFALPMDRADLETYRSCTGRNEPPTEELDEAWLVVGRRGGKSLILALIAVYLTVFRNWNDYLVPGERGAILILATDRRQARVIFRYVRALLSDVPALAALVEREDKDEIELNNGLSILVQTATFRSVRGHSICVALLDEIAFWRTEESANPDAEILAAIRPAMATIPHAKLLCASSPYARRGVLYQAHRDHFGKDGDAKLVWQAPTLTMNPTVPRDVIDEAYERDPASAAAEYGAEFRSDIESFVNREVLDAATVPGRFELPPMLSASYGYVAFVDPSGGSADSMTLAVAHRLGDVGILDAVREVKPPFSPESVVKEFVALLKTYDIATVEGDRYAGEWPRERFREHGISYEPAERSKSDIYRELLPLLNSNKTELLDLPRLHTQLATLERRTARGGRDSIDHPPGAHDDLGNAAAGALVRAAGQMDWKTIWEKLSEP
jgi:hypothetical protein